MPAQNLADAARYFDRQADRYAENAADALEELIRDANAALDNLAQGRVRQSIGGSCLNRQYYDDAERALTRFWAAKTAANVVREG
jgi:hypothetical protein